MKNRLLTGSLLLLTACSSSPAEKLDKALQTTQSWLATAHMVGETWQRGDVPDPYAQQTLEKSQKEINRETEGLNIPAELQQPLDQVQQTLKQMGSQVEQHDRVAIATSLQQLSQEQHQIEAFAKSQRGQP